MASSENFLPNRVSLLVNSNTFEGLFVVYLYFAKQCLDGSSFLRFNLFTFQWHYLSQFSIAVSLSAAANFLWPLRISSGSPPRRNLIGCRSHRHIVNKNTWQSFKSVLQINWIKIFQLEERLEEQGCINCNNARFSLTLMHSLGVKQRLKTFAAARGRGAD